MYDGVFSRQQISVVKPRVRCYNKRRDREVSGRGGIFGRRLNAPRSRSEGKFVLVEFLTAMENPDVWCSAVGKAPVPRGGLYK